jgi:hypothetical protein
MSGGRRRRGILLEIVRRQHVVGRGDERLEEAPGPRAISRSAPASDGEIARLPASTGATLTQRAIAGESSQARMKGAATGNAARPACQTARPPAT